MKEPMPLDVCGKVSATPETHTNAITQRIQKTIDRLDEVNKRLREVEDNIFGVVQEKTESKSQCNGDGFLGTAHAQLGYLEGTIDSIARITERFKTL